LRQLGANYELAATYLRWLDQPANEAAAAQLESIGTSAKTLMLRLARAVTNKKPLDMAPFAALEAAWESALGQLASRYDP
jgi:hypothetical protein